MGALLAAAIPAGLNLLGGLFGNKKQKEPETKFEFVKMRKAAEAAGFNPLTVLKATGGQPTSVSQPIPRLSSAAVVANALGTGAQAFFDAQPDPLQKERDRLEIDLMKQQLGTVQSSLARDNLTGTIVATRATTGWSGAPVTRQTQMAPRNNPNPGLSATTGPGLMTGPTDAYDDTSVESVTGVRISNMDADNPPPELETTAFTVAREGNLVPWSADLFMRNNKSTSYEDYVLEREAPYQLKKRWKKDKERNKRKEKEKHYRRANDPMKAARDMRRGSVNY